MVKRFTARRDQQAREGFTLLEILVVMGVLVIVLGFGMTLIAATLRIWHASAQAQNHWNHRHALADRFRDDVHQASEALERYESWTAGPKCLILRRAAGGHVVYAWNDGRLERSALPGGQAVELPYGPEGTEPEFLRQGPDRRLVVLQLKVSQVGGTRVQQFMAALGGDIR